MPIRPKKCSPELASREDAVAAAEEELKACRERQEATQMELDLRQADVEAHEEEGDQYFKVAIDLEIRQAELRTQEERCELKQDLLQEQEFQNAQCELANSEARSQLTEKIAEIREREEKTREDEEACVLMMRDYEDVSREVQYHRKQKAILECEILGMARRHAQLATTFRRLRAEVAQMGIEP